MGLLSVLLFYLLYMIRYMRLRLSTAEPLLVPLLPEGEETFHRVFGRISRPIAPIAIGAILMILFTLQSYPEVPTNFLVFGTELASMVFLLVSYPLWFVIFGTFAWVYFASIRGLYELGRKPLKLKHFDEDRMLGVRPIGSLSLSFAFTYFAGLGILALLPVALLPSTSSSSYTELLFVLVLSGVVFFFLPLNAVHEKMREAKHREEESLRNQLVKIVKTPNESDTEVSDSPVSKTEVLEMKEVLNRLTKVIAIDMTKQEAKSIPTWPIDAPILGRFATIIISITGILAANLIMRRIFPFLFS